MNKGYRNLRLFFGADAALLWSQLRDRQRAVRSIDIYTQVISGLTEDLSAEEGKRGQLVLIRSNELTEKKVELEQAENQHKKLYYTIGRSELKISSILECLKTEVLSYFGKSPSIKDVEKTIKESKADLLEIDTEISVLRKKFSEAIYNQAAAIDPVRDLRFAINYLNDEVLSCQERISTQDECIRAKLIEVCRLSSPLQLELLFEMGLSVADSEEFVELFFAVSQSFESTLFAVENEMESENIFDVAREGLKNDSWSLEKNISLSGSGSHHRKVRTNDNSTTWKKREIKYKGLIQVSASIKQKKWTSQSTVSALVKNSQKQYQLGRGHAAEKYSTAEEQKKTMLTESADALLFMLI
jgi:hypothetical protein